MMREILFRGKRSDNGEWVEGDLIQLHDGRRYIVNNVHGACIDDKGNFINTEEPFVCAVNPDTVGQYTGLTDKNGKRIFEGDIVECWSEGVCARGTVQQRKDGMWIIYPAWQKYIMWGLCPDEHLHTTVEVIGNIHDNPELVEVAEDDVKKAQIPEWISVKDKLPENDSHYLVFASDTCEVVECIYYGDGEWMTKDLENMTGRVTHWMPLPKHPKEGR